MKHDAWMNDLFWGRNSNMSHAHMSFVLCNLWSDCTVKIWRAAGVSVYTPRRLPETSISGKRKGISELKKSLLFSPG